MEIDWDSLPDVMGTDEAAAVLGIHRQSLVYHVRAGNIEPFKPGGLAFTPKMLRAFLEVHQVTGEGEGMTKKQLADEFGVSPSLITYYQQAGKLTPIGKRRQAWIFDYDQAKAVLESRRDAK